MNLSSSRLAKRAVSGLLALGLAVTVAPSSATASPSPSPGVAPTILFGMGTDGVPPVLTSTPSGSGLDLAQVGANQASPPVAVGAGDLEVGAITASAVTMSADAAKKLYDKAVAARTKANQSYATAVKNRDVSKSNLAAKAAVRKAAEDVAVEAERVAKEAEQVVAAAQRAARTAKKANSKAVTAKNTSDQQVANAKKRLKKATKSLKKTKRWKFKARKAKKAAVAKNKAALKVATEKRVVARQRVRDLSVELKEAEAVAALAVETARPVKADRDAKKAVLLKAVKAHDAANADYRAKEASVTSTSAAAKAAESEAARTKAQWEAAKNAPLKFKAATWNVRYDTPVPKLEKIAKDVYKNEKVSLILLQEVQNTKIVTMLQRVGYRTHRSEQKVVAWDPKVFVKQSHGSQVLSPTKIPRGSSHFMIHSSRVLLKAPNGLTLDALSYHLPASVQVSNPEAVRIKALSESMETMKNMVKNSNHSAYLYGGDDNVDEFKGFTERWDRMHESYTGLNLVQAPNATHAGGRKIDDFRTKNLTVGAGKTRDGAGDHKMHIRTFTLVR